MKPFAQGLRELARVCGRQTQRLRLIFERRKLGRLEVALGLLGWQSAEYDAPTQAHVDRLTAYEREQMRLTNESARLAHEMREIEAQRGVAEREFAEAEAAALEKEHPAAKTPEQLREQTAEQRRACKALAARLPVLDRELALAEEHYRKLVLPSTPSADAQDELLRLRKVILALPQEKAEWLGRYQDAAAQLLAMETLLAEWQSARAAFEKRDRQFARDIEARQRARRPYEKQSEALEKVKSNPYREIGRALADSGVAPINQPDALEVVLAQRVVIAAREAAIAASLAESARDGWKTSGRA